METKSSTVSSIFDLVLCLSEAVDLVSPLVSDHHRRTAQIAYALAAQAGLPQSDVRDIVIAAALHDVGGLSRQDRLGALDFEYNDPYGHPVRGYLLLRTYEPFVQAADIVRFHHIPWMNGAGSIMDGIPVSPYSHLLHLADRIAILIDPNEEILRQVDGILERVNEQNGIRFHPDWVKVFRELASREAFWLDAVYYLSLNSLRRRLDWPDISITDTAFDGLCNLFRRIIDFRSHFTATHSAGVAACARELGRLYGFDDVDCHLLYLAGLLHDLGKLAVPAELLEKPGKLTPDEFDVVRRHTYHTYRIMETLSVFDMIRAWGAYHHERMDGSGYPFHITGDKLPLGSRIVAVADIFTALTETRPYRNGVDPQEALQMLEKCVDEARVDSFVVGILRENIDLIDKVRRNAQAKADREYQDFMKTAEELTLVADLLSI